MTFSKFLGFFFSWSISFECLKNDDLTASLKWCTDDECGLRWGKKVDFILPFAIHVLIPAVLTNKRKHSNHREPPFSCIHVILSGSHLRVNSSSRNQCRIPQTSHPYHICRESIASGLFLWNFLQVQFLWLSWGNRRGCKFLGDVRSWRHPVAKSRSPLVYFLPIRLTWGYHQGCKVTGGDQGWWRPIEGAACFSSAWNIGSRCPLSHFTKAFEKSCLVFFKLFFYQNERDRFYGCEFELCDSHHSTINPFPSKWVLRALIDFTLSNARRFYSSMGNLLDRKGLNRKLIVILLSDVSLIFITRKKRGEL